MPTLANAVPVLGRGPLRRSAALLLLLSAGTLFLTVAADAQIGRYLVFYPSLTPTGQYAGDYDIYATDIFDDGTREFLAEKPKQISAQSYSEFAPTALSDGAGGAFLAYTVEHIDSLHRGDRDILMRRLDRMGNDLWGDTGGHVTVIAQSKYAEENPRMVLTTDGGVIVFYEVRYGAASDTGDVDIAAVKVAADGQMLWSSGAWIANTKRRERLKGAVSDGQGGAIAVFESSTSRDTTVTASDIYAMHIDRAGKTGWGASHAPIVVAGSKHLERNPAAVSDGLGGIYVAYELEYTSGDRTGDVDILAQHITYNGIREWLDPSALPIVSSNDKAREHSPTIALDSSGIIVAFDVTVTDQRTLSLIGVQRMDRMGRAVWNLGHKAMLFSADNRVCSAPQIVTVPSGGNYLVFEAQDSATANRDIYAQRLSADGEGLWGSGENGVPIFSTSESEHDASAMLDATGGLMVVAVKDHSTPDGLPVSDIAAQRMNSDGTLAWSNLPGPLMLTNTPLRNQAPVLVRSN